MRIIAGTRTSSLLFLAVIAFMSSLQVEVVPSPSLPSPFVSCRREDLEAIRDIAESGSHVKFCWELLDDKKQPRSCSEHDVVHSITLHPYKGSDGHIRLISRLPGIQSVSLRYCFRISDSGIAFLSAARAIRELNLSLNSSEFASDDVVPPVIRAKRDHVRAQLTDSSLVHLGKLESLEVLDISGNPFSESAICSFQGLSRLKKLVISEEQVTEEALTKLRVEFPNCQFIRRVRH